MTLLKKLRLEKGMSQLELAQYVGHGHKSNAVVSYFERNLHASHPIFKAFCEQDVLRQFAFALGYTGDPSDLLLEVE